MGDREELAERLAGVYRIMQSACASDDRTMSVWTKDLTVVAEALEYMHARAQGALAPTLAEWGDPLVQTVYHLLCNNFEPPEGEHWEGFVARRIVAALRAPDAAEAGALASKPFAYVPLSKSHGHEGEPIWRETRKSLVNNPWPKHTMMPLYASPAADAGMRERAAKVAENTERSRKALEAAAQFIRNGVELGFIRMPDTGDPAHETLPLVEGAIRALVPQAAAPNLASENANLRAALQKIANLIDSEADEPLDDAIAIARRALSVTSTDGKATI